MKSTKYLGCEGKPAKYLGSEDEIYKISRISCELLQKIQDLMWTCLVVWSLEPCDLRSLKLRQSGWKLFSLPTVLQLPTHVSGRVEVING